MQQDVFQHTFSNGLTLLAERMEHVRSAAFNFLVPAGSVHDPNEHLGLGSVLADLITRGAGERDSRALALALDNLGVDRGESVGSMHMRFWGGTLSRNLADVLALYADILRRPRLPAEDLPAVQALALQDLQSLEDEPRSKLLVELRQRFFSFPLGRDRRGTKEGIEGLTRDVIYKQYLRLFQPKSCILSVAGNFDWNHIRDTVEQHFGDWSPLVPPDVTPNRQPPTTLHMPKETTQTQIGIAYPSVPVGHDDYYAAMGAVNVL
ncbi:MAG: M16 family metallopeptidase, partial [Gemmataceae bacterium]